MKRDTLKNAFCGVTLTTLALSIALPGCGGSGNGAVTPVTSPPKSTSLPVVCSNTANTARYQVKDFGTSFSPAAANASSQVVGTLLVNGKPRSAIALNGTITDLGIDNSHPVTINNTGQVAGYGVGVNGQTSGFVWQNGRTTWLQNLPGGTTNGIVDMNNRGEIVGSATTGQKNSQGQDIAHAVYWANAQAAPQDLGVLNPGDDSVATSINDQGQIVGYSGIPIVGSSVYIYLASHASQMQTLGLVAARRFGSSYAQLTTIYITNSGLIVGATFLNALESQVFLMRYGSAPTYQPTLGVPSKPNANDQFIATTVLAGVTAGYSLYDPGKGVQDLTSQLPSACSVDFQSPVVIANGGQIIANGTEQGVAHGFLITH